LFRKHQVAQQQRTTSRAEFEQKVARRCKKVVYSDNLAKLPRFEVWFATTLTKEMAIGAEVGKYVISIKTSPSEMATAYRSMWAFGNHL